MSRFATHFQSAQDFIGVQPSLPFTGSPGHRYGSGVPVNGISFGGKFENDRPYTPSRKSNPGSLSTEKVHVKAPTPRQLSPTKKSFFDFASVTSSSPGNNESNGKGNHARPRSMSASSVQSRNSSVLSSQSNTRRSGDVSTITNDSYLMTSRSSRFNN